MQAAIFPPLEEVCPRLRRCTQWSKQGVHISYKYHSRAAEDFAKNREKSFKKKKQRWGSLRQSSKNRCWSKEVTHKIVDGYSAQYWTSDMILTIFSKKKKRLLILPKIQYPYQFALSLYVSIPMVSMLAFYTFSIERVADCRPNITSCSNINCTYWRPIPVAILS